MPPQALTGMALVGWWLAAEVVDDIDWLGEYGELPAVFYAPATTSSSGGPYRSHVN